jgi:quinol monooxygenase YgiN
VTEMVGVVTIVSREGKEAELLGVLRQMRSEVLTEPGCDLYLIVAVSREPRMFILVERYRDKDALKAHQRNPALTSFGAALEQLTESMEIRIGAVASAPAGEGS